VVGRDLIDAETGRMMDAWGLRLSQDGAVTEPQPEMRIGDREREAIDQRLRAAHADGVLTLGEYDERAAACFAARTQNELDVLVRDLPPAPDAPSLVKAASSTATPSAPAPPAQRHGSGRGRNSLIAIGIVALGVFAGTQVVGSADGVSIFGNSRVTVNPGADRVEVGMMFGNVTVVIPDNVQAVPAGFTIFGNKNCELACQPGPAGARQVVVRGNGAFGNINIVRPGETLNKDKDKDKDDD
jgi:hypothetical protein